MAEKAKEFRKKEFVLEVYKSKWDYYKETLVNRKNTLDWYFKIITIIVTGFAGAIYVSTQTNLKNIEWEEVIFFATLLILLCGIGLFLSYSIETGIGNNYIEQIKSLEKLLIEAEMKNNLGYIYESTGFWRVSPIIFINSFAAAASTLIHIHNPYEIWIGIFIFFTVLQLHYFIYPKMINVGLKKGNTVYSKLD